MLEVRKVTREDCPQIAQLGIDEAAQAAYPMPTLNPTKAQRHYETVLETGDGVVICNGGEMVGAFLWLPVQPYYSDEWFAYMFFSFLKPEFRRSTVGLNAYRAFKRWAGGKNIRMCLEHQLGGGDMGRLDKWFERMGLTKIGATFIEG